MSTMDVLDIPSLSVDNYNKERRDSHITLMIFGSITGSGSNQNFTYDRFSICYVPGLSTESFTNKVLSLR